MGFGKSTSGSQCPCLRLSHWYCPQTQLQPEAEAKEEPETEAVTAAATASTAANVSEAETTTQGGALWPV